MSEKIVQIDDLEGSDYDLYYENKYEGEYFTGTAISDDNGVHTEWTFVNGNGHGRWFSVFPNGQLYEETILDDGEVISDREWNREGQLLYRFDSEPLLEQKFDANGRLLEERTEEHYWKFYDNGQLLKEETKEHKWTFHANGAKHEDYDYVSSQATVFDDSGVWIVKGKLKKINDRYWSDTIDSMTFNHDRWSSNYLSILKADYEDKYPYFLEWLKNRSEIRAEIICSLIENEDLRFEYDGMLLAREYRILDAIPVIEKQLTINLEHSRDPMSVACFTGTVLDDLKRLCQEMIVLKLASEKESFSDIDVKEALNISTGRTIILLSNMAKKGELQRISKGKYRLNRES